MLKKYLKLFLSFFKIGAFTFGSGYAMITLLKKEIVENNHWMSERNIADIIAIAESTRVRSPSPRRLSSVIGSAAF